MPGDRIQLVIVHYGEGGPGFRHAVYGLRCADLGWITVYEIADEDRGLIRVTPEAT